MATSKIFFQFVRVLHALILAILVNAVPANGDPSCVPAPGIRPRPWSDPASWGQQVPMSAKTRRPTMTTSRRAQAAAGEIVTIPCGSYIIFDLNWTTVTSPLKLHQLRVLGHLTFVDSRRMGPIFIEANHILVEGKMSIGSATRQFSNRVQFRLMSDEPQRRNLTASDGVNVGTKAFVVYKGAVSFHGLPGTAKTPAWVLLRRNAKAGDRAITVNADVSAWPVGGRIVVAPTSTDRAQVEERIIARILNKATILLTSPLTYSHWGNPIPVPGQPGRFFSEAAEVALLSRNIVIEGEVGTAPGTQLIGGHFAIMGTTQPIQLEGVEFRSLGQQGRIGRYPCHWHFVWSGSRSYVKKCAVHRSFQRAYVIHATSNLLVQENVAYLIKGHVYMTEDGMEMGNRFIRNLGIITDPVKFVIPLADMLPPPDGNSNGFANSDGRDPSIFWIAHPNQTWIGNRAVGSAQAGFWIEAAPRVRGPSQQLPGAKGFAPGDLPLALFTDNVAHSNKDGFKTYPQGYAPKDADGNYVPTYIRRFTAYKNRFFGFLCRDSEGPVWVVDSLLADNFKDIQYANIPANAQRGCGVANSTVIGESENGPFDAGVGANPRPEGFELDHGFLGGNFVEGVYFAGFDGRIPPTGEIPAIAFYFRTQDDFTPLVQGNWARRLRFAPGTVELYLPPNGNNFAYHDGDGSLSGTGQRAFVVSSTPGMLPPGPSAMQNCELNSAWNAYACTGVCYRSLAVELPVAGPQLISVTRVGVQEPEQIVEAPPRIRYSQMFRADIYGYNLPADEITWTLNILAPRAFPPGRPLTMYYADMKHALTEGIGCTRVRLTLLFPPDARRRLRWVLAGGSNTCMPSGNISKISSTTHVYRRWCDSTGGSWLEVQLGKSPLVVMPVNATDALPQCVCDPPPPAPPPLPPGFEDPPPRSTVVYRINCGASSSRADGEGNTWLADAFFSGGVAGQDHGSDMFNVSPSLAFLLQTSRTSRVFQYLLPVLAGYKYSIALYFDENYFNSARRRVFDVYIDGSLVDSDFDIFAAAGKNTATSRTYTVSAQSSTLRIGLAARIDQAKLNAIRVAHLP